MPIYVLRIILKEFLFVFLFSFCLTLCAQNSPLDPRASIDEVWRKDSNIPVSGEIRTGLVADISSTEYVQEYFFVNLPEQKSDVLFVEITSNDGRYNATLSYDVKNQPPGPLKLKWSTQFYHDLKEFSYRELTILSWFVKKENQPYREFIRSSWTSLDSKEFIYIILNSEQQAFINLYDASTDNSTNIKCKQFTNQVHVSFNSYCEVPLDSIKQNTEISIIQRARRSYNKYPINLKL